MLRSIVSVAAVAVVAVNAASDRVPTSECWNIGNNKAACENSYDSVSDCIYCLAGAVPPVCVNSDQAARLPEGVFECQFKTKDDMASIMQKLNWA